jgi:hypothetical protein
MLFNCMQLAIQLYAIGLYKLHPAHLSLKWRQEEGPRADSWQHVTARSNTEESAQWCKHMTRPALNRCKSKKDSMEGKRSV